MDRPRSAWPVAILATILVFGMRTVDVEPVLALAAAGAVVLVLGLAVVVITTSMGGESPP